jgi:hypothetical protein
VLKRTPERENLLLLAIAKGLPLKAACKLAGPGFTTFNGWREEDSFFAQKIEFAEAQAIERNLALLSQVSALSNSSQPMDPKLQAELERLIRAEAQRTEQENFDWACGMVVGVVVLVGFALFILIAMGAGQ